MQEGTRQAAVGDQYASGPIRPTIREARLPLWLQAHRHLNIWYIFRKRSTPWIAIRHRESFKWTAGQERLIAVCERKSTLIRLEH